VTRDLDLTWLDRTAVAYALAFLAALALRGGVPARLALPLTVVHVLFAAAALVAPRARSAGGALGLLGEFYPLLALFPLYSALGLLNQAAGRSHDTAVMAWEEAIFGGQPALRWSEAMPWPWLSGLLHAAYLSYYAIVAGAPLGLWIAGRRAAARRTLALEMLTFYLCYLAFLAFPVAGPRYLFPLPDNAALSQPVARLAHRLVAEGSAWGTAFPSSHVAVAVVASGSALQAWRALGAPLAAAAVLLALGTVYGQFHYGVDAAAGAALGALVLALAGRARNRAAA
jgi:membrane-associated phospholipid phosphatase